MHRASRRVTWPGRRSVIRPVTSKATHRVSSRVKAKRVKKRRASPRWPKPSRRHSTARKARSPRRWSRLALDIAQQVVRQHVQHDPTALIAAAREVLATEPALVGAPALIVSPADLPVVEAYLMEELQTRGWTVRTDPSVERGGCRAQAGTGEVDAGIDTRWERVAAALGKVSTW